jgi:hypothetical protein
MLNISKTLKLALVGAVTWIAMLMSEDTAIAQNAQCQSSERFVVYCIRPSEADPRVARFDDPHFVIYSRSTRAADQPLLVFLPGTNGKPPGAPDFLRTAVENGYRAISLAYNDDVSIAVYCPRNGGPECSARFRRMRLYGEDSIDPRIDNTRPEAIVNRLNHLLRYLDAQHPDENWSRYFDQNGIVWERIALAGQSQGAGMAAFIGKQKVVNRIILFSSPWDFYIDPDGQRILAPWLAWSVKTPLDRWYAGYNQRENTAALLARAYAMLRIPPDHIRVFSNILPNAQPGDGNPYHGQGVHNIAYRPDWIFFLTNR